MTIEILQFYSKICTFDQEASKTHKVFTTVDVTTEIELFLINKCMYSMRVGYIEIECTHIVMQVERKL